MGIYAPIANDHNIRLNRLMGERVNDIQAQCAAIVRRARRAEELKARIVLKIPYHEWADAVARNRTSDLIDAYTPRFYHGLNDYGDAARCPPWASRRYRASPVTPSHWNEIGRHVAAHRDRITGEWGSLKSSIEREMLEAAQADAADAADGMRRRSLAGLSGRMEAKGPGALAAALERNAQGGLSAVMRRMRGGAATWMGMPVHG